MVNTPQKYREGTWEKVLIATQTSALVTLPPAWLRKFNYDQKKNRKVLLTVNKKGQVVIEFPKKE